MGKKPTEKKVKISVHIDQELHDFLERQANDKGLPLSLVVNLMLRKACNPYLKNKNSKTMF